MWSSGDERACWHGKGGGVAAGACVGTESPVGEGHFPLVDEDAGVGRLDERRGEQRP